MHHKHNFPKILVFAFLLLLFQGPVEAEDSQPENDTLKMGFALSYGNSFHPDNDIGFIQANYLAMFNNEHFGTQTLPKNLRFKVELNFGGTTTPDHWLMVSGAGLALYYLDFLDSPSVRPYIEGGLGIIYTGFRVEGQGSHLNFNPKAEDWPGIPHGPSIAFYRPALGSSVQCQFKPGQHQRRFRHFHVRGLFLTGKQRYDL